MYELVETLVAEHRRELTAAEAGDLLMPDVLHSLAPKGNNGAPVFYLPQCQWEFEDEWFSPIFSFYTRNDGLSYIWELLGTISEDGSHWDRVDFIAQENRVDAIKLARRALRE